MELDGHRWYKTGDKGRLDGDGFITTVDRYSRFAKKLPEGLLSGDSEDL